MNECTDKRDGKPCRHGIVVFVLGWATTTPEGIRNFLIPSKDIAPRDDLKLFFSDIRVLCVKSWYDLGGRGGEHETAVVKNCEVGDSVPDKQEQEDDSDFF